MARGTADYQPAPSNASAFHAPQQPHRLQPWVQALAEAIKAQTNELHTSVTSMKEMLQNIDRSSRQVSCQHTSVSGSCAQRAAAGCWSASSASPAMEGSLPCPGMGLAGAQTVQEGSQGSWTGHAMATCRAALVLWQG